MHPIFVYISCPRSYSVTIARIMDQTGHFTIWHEAYGSVHIKKYYPDALKVWCREKYYQTAEEIKRDIFAAAEKSPVFVKDMALSIHDFIIDDVEFLSNPNVYFIFAYRHPNEVVHSMYPKSEAIMHQNPDVFTQIMGYDNLLKLYEKTNCHNKNVLLLNATDLNAAIYKIFDFMKLKCDVADLIWESCDTDEKLERKAVSWHENKILSIFKHWHGTAMLSSGVKIEKKSYECIDGVPTFIEVPENHRASIIKCYHNCMRTYRLLEDCHTY